MAAHEKELQRELMNSISRLTDGVVHQFNNQLTVIQGYSDMLLRQLGQDNPTREAVEEIDRAARKASGMTSRLLAFSGVGSSRVDLQACKLEYSIVSPK